MSTLVDIKSKKRKQNRELDLKPNPIKKDERFDQLLETTRERIENQGELEQYLQKYNT